MDTDQTALHIKEFLEGASRGFIERLVARILDTKVTTSRIERDDVFQDVRIALFQAFTDRHYRGGDLGAFVTSVTKTQILLALRAQYRRDSRYSPAGEPDAFPSPMRSAEEQLEYEQKRALAARIVRRIGLECRRILISRFIQEHSYGEIALELSTTEGNARVMVHRCLTKSRELAREFDDMKTRDVL